MIWGTKDYDPIIRRRPRYIAKRKPPFLMGLRSRVHAASFSFWAELVPLSFWLSSLEVPTNAGVLGEGGALSLLTFSPASSPPVPKMAQAKGISAVGGLHECLQRCYQPVHRGKRKAGVGRMAINTEALVAGLERRLRMKKPHERR